MSNALLSENAVIYLRNDITFSSTIAIEKNTILDLNGHNLIYDSSSSYALIIHGGTVTIMNGAVRSAGARGISVVSPDNSYIGRINLEDLTISAKIHCLLVDAPVNVSVVNCTFNTEGSAWNYYTLYVKNTSQTADKAPEVTIEHSSLTNAGCSCLVVKSRTGNALTQVKVSDGSSFAVSGFADADGQDYTVISTMHTDFSADGSTTIEGEGALYSFAATSEGEDIPSSGSFSVPLIYQKLYVREIDGKKAQNNNEIPWGNLVQLAKETNQMLFCFMAGDGSKFNRGGTDEDKWGDACLVIFPNGKTMLIDGGMPDFGPVLVASLKKVGVEKLDYMMLSHSHNDHWGGLFDNGTQPGAWAAFRPDKFFTNGSYNRDTVKNRVDSYALKYGTEIVRVREGYSCMFGDVRMDILWPEEGIGDSVTGTEEVNSSSIVAKFTYNNISALFTGDLYSAAERELIAKYGEDLDSVILKICHHGRTTSSTPEFAQAVSAEVGVATGYTVLGDDGYGRMNSINNVRDSFEKAGTAVYCDYDNGFILIGTDGNSWNIRCSKDL